jgi:hypothetical protein
MTAYTNQQLNTIYSYIGYNFYVTFEPQIKSVIIATQAEADGGVQPDDTLQLQVLAIVANLQMVDQQLVNLINVAFVDASSSGAKIDVARGDYNLRKLGRALIKQLCIIFGIKGVRSKYYNAPQLRSEGDETTGGMSYFPEDF